MSEMYTVQEIPGKGRGLVALKDIKAGTKILEDRPYAACLEQQCVADTSYYSFESSPSLMRCAGCKFARYASKAEQKADWQDGHKFECKALAAIAPNYPSAEIRLLARALWKREVEESNKGSLERKHSERFARVMDLVDHWDSLAEIHKQSFTARAMEVKYFMACAGKASPVEDVPLIAKLVAKNNFTGFSTSGANGVGIFPLAALINHSCEPNCCQSFKGKVLRLLALKDIQAGEDITITYISESAVSKPDRRHKLLREYRFDIYSEEERRNLHMNIMASQEISASGLLIKVNFLRRPPCQMDDTDCELVAVTRRTGDDNRNTTSKLSCQRLKGSGVIAHKVDSPTLADGILAKLLHFNRKDERTVDIWGPVFLKGDSIDWDQILALVKYAAVCLRLIDMNDDKLAPETMWPWVLVADHAEAKLRTQSSIELGPHHAIRQETDYAKLFAGTRLRKYEETYPEGQRLHASGVVMKSRNIVELFRMDKSMARTASRLGKKEDALMFAKSALKITLLLYPDQSDEINLLKAIISANK